MENNYFSFSIILYERERINMCLHNVDAEAGPQVMSVIACNT